MPAPLRLGTVVRGDGDDVIEGVLVCADAACEREHPIIDGIPIIVPDVPQFIRDYGAQILARDDLSAFTQGMLADCLGAESEFGYNRSLLSSYAHGHYELAGGLGDLLETGLGMLSARPSGMWLDTGCATGGGCVKLAGRGAELVLGVDLNFSMLRFARRLMTDGRASYPLRRTGVVYDERTVEIDLSLGARIELWACDATALPFHDGRFDGVLSCNVLDSVSVPVFHLAETGRVVRSGGETLIACPYDWSSKVTDLARWIGGHSQRSHSQGSSPGELRRLLSDASPPEMQIPLRLVREDESVPWRVYMHERATAEYRTHLIVARSE